MRVVRKGTLIDATIIGSATKGDNEAAWVKHESRAPAHGYKAHIAADKDTGMIRKVETTSANEADVSIAPAIIPDEPGEVYADRAYDALSVEKAIEAKGGTAKLMRKGHRWLARRNARSTQPPAAAHPRTDRENLRHLEAQLSFSRDAMDRACQSQSAKSISPPSPTTSNASGGLKRPERSGEIARRTANKTKITALPGLTWRFLPPQQP